MCLRPRFWPNSKSTSVDHLQRRNTSGLSLPIHPALLRMARTIGHAFDFLLDTLDCSPIEQSAPLDDTDQILYRNTSAHTRSWSLMSWRADLASTTVSARMFGLVGED